MNALDMEFQTQKNFRDIFEILQCQGDSLETIIKILMDLQDRVAVLEQWSQAGMPQGGVN